MEDSRQSLLEARRDSSRRNESRTIDSRSDDGSSDLDDLRSMAILLDVAQALDVSVDSGSSKFEKGGSKEGDPMVTDRDRSGRFEESVEDHGSKTG